MPGGGGGGGRYGNQKRGRGEVRAIIKGGIYNCAISIVLDSSIEKKNLVFTIINDWNDKVGVCGVHFYKK